MTKGERIRFARQAMGMTLEELALRCGTTRQTIHKYETGIITNIPTDRIETIACVLNVTESYIMGWDEKTSNNKDTDEEILNMIKNLSEDKRKLLLKMIEAMVEE